MRDARDYVRLAEPPGRVIPRAVGDAYVWGDALDLVDRKTPCARIVNLETSVTSCDAFWPKGINYRMNPGNVGCLTAARLDVCILANNHVLDFGQQGLLETLDTLGRAGLAVVGAGRTEAEAFAPVRVRLDARHDLVLIACGTDASGIPERWAARGDHPGVARLRDLSERTATQLLDRIAVHRRPGDILAVSIHWGSNWGYDVEPDEVRFAHRLVDGGVDLIHGHSSHHPRPIEVYRERLILYGCGDLLNDYEGISGHERYRSELVLAYLPTLAEGGQLTALDMIPLRIERMRLNRVDREEAIWLARTLSTTGERFGTRARVASEAELSLDWPRE